MQWRLTYECFICIMKQKKAAISKSSIIYDTTYNFTTCLNIFLDNVYWLENILFIKRQMSVLSCHFIYQVQPDISPNFVQIIQMINISFWLVLKDKKIWVISFAVNSERPNHSKLSSAEPRSFGRISGHKLRRKQ